jgi:hypothetical protein
MRRWFRRVQKLKRCIKKTKRVLLLSKELHAMALAQKEQRLVQLFAEQLRESKKRLARLEKQKSTARELAYAAQSMLSCREYYQRIVFDRRW